MSETYDIVIVTYNRYKLLEECVSKAINQKHRPDRIIIVNNASTDNTKEYLDNIQSNMTHWPQITVINLESNTGGAGGFYAGIKESLRFSSRWVVIIDDDAMLRNDFWLEMEKGIKENQNVQCFACTVYVNGKIDCGHRSRVHYYKKRGIRRKKYVASLLDDYDQDYFKIDNATFCGLVINKEIIKTIGLPEKDYFIWNDDTEYCIRIKEKSDIINVTRAGLDHKTNLLAGSSSTGELRYVWKEYYGIRNRIDIAKKYDSFFEVIMTLLSLKKRAYFCKIRTVIDRDNRDDWEYNYQLLRNAIRDGFKGRLGRNALY